MAGKKKGKKGKKKKKIVKVEEKKEKPSFVPRDLTPSPVAVKVHHFDEIFLIYSDEYQTSGKITEEIAKILGKETKELKLYFSNKREVELEVVNHDQQIVNNIDLFLITLKENGPPEIWESLKDVLSYNIYDINVDQLQPPQEEKKEGEEEDQKIDALQNNKK